MRQSYPGEAGYVNKKEQEIMDMWKALQVGVINRSSICLTFTGELKRGMRKKPVRLKSQSMEFCQSGVSYRLN